MWQNGGHQDGKRQEGKQGPEPVKAADLWTIAGVGLALLLAIAVVTVSVVQAADPGPKLGDIVSFRPDRPVSDALLTTVTLARAAPGQGTCDIATGTVSALGGSFVVEERRTGAERGYRLHWAGMHTSTGPHDCGAAADLLASPSEVVALAQAAGGFGASRKSLVLASGMGGAGGSAGLVN
jgi:hypothetical protein